MTLALGSAPLIARLGELQQPRVAARRDRERRSRRSWPRSRPARCGSAIGRGIAGTLFCAATAGACSAQKLAAGPVALDRRPDEGDPGLARLAAVDRHRRRLARRSSAASRRGRAGPSARAVRPPRPRGRSCSSRSRRWRSAARCPVDRPAHAADPAGLHVGGVGVGQRRLRGDAEEARPAAPGPLAGATRAGGEGRARTMRLGVFHRWRMRAPASCGHFLTRLTRRR